jgi:hypothetical protein
MTMTEKTTEHGYYWRYDHSPDEPYETLDAAIMMAVEVAAVEARKARRTYYVTSTPAPVALYILRSDHPELLNPAMDIMFELTPKGKAIRRPKPVRH